jgi:hypothetical protein
MVSNVNDLAREPAVGQLSAPGTGVDTQGLTRRLPFIPVDFHSASCRLAETHYVEDRRGGRDGLVRITLIVQKHAHADASRSAFRSADVCGALHAERADLAARHEHDVPADHLQLPGSGDVGGEVGRGALQDDVLGPNMQRGIRRREFGV